MFLSLLAKPNTSRRAAPPGRDRTPPGRGRGAREAQTSAPATVAPAPQDLIGDLSASMEAAEVDLVQAEANLAEEATADLEEEDRLVEEVTVVVVEEEESTCTVLCLVQIW